MKKFALVFCFPLLVWPFLQGQDMDLGVVGGIAVYSGDLSAQEFGIYLDDIGVGASIFTRTRFTRFLGVRTSFTYAHLSGNEKRGGGNLQRGLNFNTDLFELSVMGEWNIFHTGYYSAKTTFSPYVTLGVGAFYFDPRITMGSREIRLRPLGTEGQGVSGYPSRYSPVQFSIPVGFGVHFIIKDQWTIGYELIARRSQTDYLDDVSDQSVIYGDVLLNNGELAAQVSNPSLSPVPANYTQTYTRGGRFNDWFYVTGITIAYRIRNSGTSRSRYMERNGCPRF
ncbi:MAG: outer membrane beta-barrel protein [Haliscomenobacter sp.]|nr:outer membrane beta-barrel protein [Haliscomenobacter sp.]